VKEDTVLFGPERVLVGTHTFGEQPQGTAPGLGVILTNAGVLSRTGPHGINVLIARALARVGVPSIRFDMSGLGDSRRPARPLPFEQQFIVDTRLALDEAQARHGVRHFAMIGFCSGADIAHLTALQDERLCGLLLWDPYIYPTLRSRFLHVLDRMQEFGLPDAARRALRGAVRAIVGYVRRRQTAQGQQAPASRLRYGRTYIPPAREFAAHLRQLLDRGVDIKIVYTGGFRSDYNYASQYRDSFRGLGIADRISCIFLSRADHTLTSRSAQQALLQIVVEWIGSLGASPGPAPVSHSPK
jgi:hypothetical protein